MVLYFRTLGYKFLKKKWYLKLVDFLNNYSPFEIISPD